MQGKYGTYVKDDRLIAKVAEGLGGTVGAPVELDRATDSVDTAAESDNTIIVESDIVRRAVVRGVQVVGVGREFGGKGVDLLDPGADVERQSVGTDFVLGALDGIGNLSVGETHLLSLQDLILLQVLEATGSLELSGAVDNVLQLVEEPLVDLGQLMDLLDRVVLVEHGLADGEPSAVSGVLKLKVEILKLVALESDESGVDLADSLLERLLKGSADSHDLTDRLHGAANVALDVLELGKIPPRNLGHNVVQGGLKVGGSGLGDSVGQLGEGVSETNLGGGVSQGVSGSLGGQSRRSRKTGVDLDDSVVKTIRLEGVLDVTLANDTEMSDNLDGSASEHVVLLIAQGLAGGDDNRVTSVDTKRIKVLHVAHGDAVVVGIADHLVFDLLPALERLLDKDLRGEGQGASGHVSELFLVVGEAGAETTQGIGSSDNDGVSDLFGSVESLLDGTDGDRLGNGDFNLLQSLGEEVTVLGQLEGPDAGAEDLDAVLLKEAESLHLDTQVEGGLSTKGQENAIGLLLLDDIGDVLGGDGEVVDLVSQTVVGLDGSDVGVDENRGDASLLQGLEGLGSYRVVRWLARMLICK